MVLSAIQCCSTSGPARLSQQPVSHTILPWEQPASGVQGREEAGMPWPSEQPRQGAKFLSSF